MEFANQTVIVTGASGNLGRAVAEARLPGAAPTSCSSASHAETLVAILRQ